MDILIGIAKNVMVYIPRIPIIITDSRFEFKRFKFPVKLLFAITINKTQDQTLKLAASTIQISASLMVNLRRMFSILFKL